MTTDKIETDTVTQFEVHTEAGIDIPESSNRGPAPLPPQQTPAPNPRLIVTQPSTDSLHNVVRYNTADPFEGIEEESHSASYHSSKDESYQGEGSGREGGGLRKYGSVSEGLEELIESLNSMVGDGSSESDDEDDYVNQETVDSFVGRSIGEVVDDEVGVKERPVSEHIHANVSFFESIAKEESGISVPQIKIEVSDGEVLLNSECFSESEFEKDKALQIELDDDIFARSINENIEFFENLNKVEDEPELEHINKPTLLRSHHTRGLSDATVNQSFESLDREAMDANLADLDAEIENLRNMTALEGLIGEFVADLEGSFSNDPVDSDEVVAVEQLIEMKEKCLREEAERELSRRKRRSRHRSKQEDRTRKRPHSESLTEEEREAALLALYSARIHQRKSFNKNFIKILYQSNPDLASRENIVSEAKSLNNSLDRYQLKSYQNAAVLEYGKLKSELISQKRQGRSKKNVKVGKRPASSSKKKVVENEKNDLALLVDEIANAFPPNSTTSASDDLKKSKPPVSDAPQLSVLGKDQPVKSCQDSGGGGYDSMSSTNSVNKPQKPKRKASLDDDGGGYDSMTSEGERKGTDPEKQMDDQAMETAIKTAADEPVAHKSNDDECEKMSKSNGGRKNSLDAEGGGYDSMTTDDDKNQNPSAKRKDSLDGEGGGYDSLSTDIERNQKPSAAKKNSLDAEGGGYDSMTDDEKNKKASAQRKDSLDAEGGGYDSLTTDDGKVVKSALPRKNSLDAEGGGYDSMSDNPGAVVKIDADGGGYDSMSSDLISEKKKAKLNSEGGGYDTMPDEPEVDVKVASQPLPPAPPPISAPPPTLTSTGSPMKPAPNKTSPPYSRPNLPNGAPPGPPKLPSGPPPTVPDHVPPPPSTDLTNPPVKVQEDFSQGDGYDGDTTDDSSFVLSSLSGICDSDLSVFYSDGQDFRRGSAASDVIYHYDTDPDDVSFSESADRGRSAVALNDYIIGPTDAFHRRTQSIAVMEHQMKKCDSLLDDFDYIQLQQYRKNQVSTNSNFYHKVQI